MKTQFIFLWMIVCGLTAYAQESLDRTFGNGGIVQFPGTTEIMLMDFDSDGHIICAGYSYSDNSADYWHYLTLTKTDADGRPDAGFGTNGVVSTRILYSAWPVALAVQPDNKILVSGSADVEKWNGRKSFVIRYLPDGTPDETFGDGGTVFFDLSDGVFGSIAVLADGSLLLGGTLPDATSERSILRKLDATGATDTSFGTGGTVDLSEPGFRFFISSFTMLSDNTLLCLGSEYSDGETKLACCRTDLAGKKIVGFGQDGKWVKNTYTDFDWDTESFQSAFEQPDGKFLLTGLNPLGFLFRMNPDGSPDTGFGDNGMVSLRNGHESYPFRDAALLPDGSVIIGGVKKIDYISGNDAYAFGRFGSDGRRDASFGTDGELVVDISPEHDYIQCMKLQGTDKVIAAGSGYLDGKACFSILRVNAGKGSADRNEAIAAGDNWTVYPNPFVDRIYVAGSSPVKRITLYDALGRKIAVLPEDHQTFAVPDVPAGIYFLIIETKEGRFISRKAIKKY